MTKEIKHSTECRLMGRPKGTPQTKETKNKISKAIKQKWKIQKANSFLNVTKSKDFVPQQKQLQKVLNK